MHSIYVQHACITHHAYSRYLCIGAVYCTCVTFDPSYLFISSSAYDSSCMHAKPDKFDCVHDLQLQLFYAMHACMQSST